MKRIRRQSNPDFLLYFVLVCALHWACNVREPGCLDIEAQNFDFDADRHDEEMCVYPNLLLNVLYQWADSSLQQGFLYRNAMGTDYAIHGVQILFCDFSLQNSSGEEVQVEEVVTFITGACNSGSSVEAPDDFVFVDRSTFNYVIGAFRTSGPMQRATLSMGVRDTYTPLCIESLPVTHKLRNPRAAYDETKGEFAIGRFIISRDSVNAIRDTLFVYRMSEELAFDLTRTFRQGRPDTLFMSIDFRNIFDPADLSMPDSVIAADLGSRIRASVHVQ
jgi:hypothetical protein